MTGVLIERGSLNTDTYREKTTWRDTGGNGHVQAKERGVGKTLPSGLSLGTSPTDTLILDFQPQNCETMVFDV